MNVYPWKLIFINSFLAHIYLACWSKCLPDKERKKEIVLLFSFCREKRCQKFLRPIPSLKIHDLEKPSLKKANKQKLANSSIAIYKILLYFEHTSRHLFICEYLYSALNHSTVCMCTMYVYKVVCTPFWLFIFFYISLRFMDWKIANIDYQIPTKKRILERLLVLASLNPSLCRW